MTSSAFLASLSLTCKLLRSILPDFIDTALSNDLFAVEAHQDWSARCQAEDMVELRKLDSEHCPRQRDLTRSVQKKVQAGLPPGDQRTQAFRASLGVPGAKDWLKCQPAPGMKTHIADWDYRVWFRFYCRIPLVEPDTVCPRLGCTEKMDVHGDHLLHCANGLRNCGSPRTWRHDSQVRLVASDLRRATRTPIVEPRTVGTHMERPDIKALGREGGTDYLDVTISHPLSSA